MADDFVHILFEDLAEPLGNLIGETELLHGIYMKFTATDPAYGSFDFRIGEIAFDAGADKVYAAVTSWGALRNFMSVGGSGRDSETEIEMVANAIVTPSDATNQFTIATILRDFQIYNVQVDIMQWVEGASPILIWSGFIRGIGQMRHEQGICTISVVLASTTADKGKIISDVITAAPAPVDSFGKMVPRAYGSFRTGLQSVDLDSSNQSIFLGYGSRFVEGVIVDQNLTSSKIKVQFAKNDGTDGAKAFQEGVADNVRSRGDIWLWIPSENTYALVDPDSTTFTNDSNETSVVIEPNPMVYVALRINTPGARMNSSDGSGFLGDVYKPIDDDASNYLETTSSDYVISYEMPSCSIPGLQPVNVALVWRVKGNGTFSGTRSYTIGIWDANYLAGKSALVSGVSNSYDATVYGPSGGYQAADFDLVSDFSQGKFVGRDGSSNETPLQVVFAMSGTPTAGLRFYDLGAVVKGRLAIGKVMIGTPAQTESYKIYDIHGRFVRWGERVVTPARSTQATQANVAFLATGKFQNDSVGTYDTSGEEIRNAAGIAHHLLASIGGMSVNTTSGTLGNFTDAKVESVATEKNLDPTLGPDKTYTVIDAVDAIQSRYPIRIHEENGEWQCIFDEMNPHSSRMYRSSSDIVRISARKHILDSSLTVSHAPFDEIVNDVSLNYGHSFGTNRALRNFKYTNPLSQHLFGAKPQKLVDEPWLTVDQLPSDTEAAKFLARYTGRVNARPRLTVNLKLSEELFDIRIGHIVEFDKDMEDVGIMCPAYRCGRFDYIFPNYTESNQADSTTPTFIPSSGSGAVVFMLSQQTDQITCWFSDTASYTTNPNGWWYWDASGFSQALTNVTTSDGVDPDDFFKTAPAAGFRTLYFDRPDPWLWRKDELDFMSTPNGPSYAMGMLYINATNSCVGNAVSTYPAIWWGRLFEVIEATRKPGAESDYPYVDVVLQEVM